MVPGGGQGGPKLSFWTILDLIFELLGTNFGLIGVLLVSKVNGNSYQSVSFITFGLMGPLLRVSYDTLV